MGKNIRPLNFRLPSLEKNPLAVTWLNRILDRLDELESGGEFERKEKNGFLKLFAGGIKNIGKNPRLWNLAGKSVILRLYGLFYRLLEGPNLDKLSEKNLVELVEEDEREGCRVKSEEDVFPWVTGPGDEVCEKTVCVMFAGRIYRLLFMDLLEELKEVFPEYTFVLPEKSREIEVELEVEYLEDKPVSFTPEYFWAWGYTSALGARALEWLGRTVIVAPAVEPWYSILPERQHELLYPSKKPWLGIPVLERLKNRGRKREELLELSARRRKQEYAPENIFKTKILPLLK